MMKTRTYTELCRLHTFFERFEYLALRGAVGATTFGFDRWLNQEFYSSHEWQVARRETILRDNGCDLGVEGYEIHTDLLVHHMNPMTVRDIENGESWIIDPEFLITTRHRTHNAIHYGDASLLPRPHVERRPGDTALWTPMGRKPNV
jgi:hypothetical protein